MTVLPSDILSQVLDYACTDGGSTACAIRQASMTFRDEVEPYRFRSIAVCGEYHLNLVCVQLTTWLFDDLGTSRPDRKVDHLCVSCSEPETSNDTWALPKLARWLQLAPGLSTTSSFDLLLLKLTSLCAPHLTSLTVVLTCNRHRGPHQWIAPVIYPELSTLSIRFQSTDDLFKPTAQHRPELPALRKLSIHCESHFLGPGPLASVGNKASPIDVITFQGPADSYIHHYTLARFNDALGPDILACRLLELRLTSAPILQSIFDGTSVLVEDSLQKISTKDKTLTIV